MIRLEEIFTLLDYEQCLQDISNRTFFDREFTSKNKKFKFSFRFDECDNGMWKDNLLITYGAEYKDSGFGCPCSIDYIDSYKEICERVNKLVERIGGDIWVENGLRVVRPN